MLLEKNLLTLVEKLRERIDVHGDTLRQSEMQTRYALIDPLLRELGWDTENPALVRPEFKVAGKADYALLGDGEPIMMVEAKKLDEPLQDKALDQAIKYCMRKGTRYCSVTDGRRWEIYEPHRGTIPITEKRVVQFDLKDQSAAEACLKALALWEIRVSGRIGIGQTPVVVPTPNRPAQPESPTPNTQPTPPSPDEHEWQTIAGLNPQRGSRPRPPVEIRFPDNSVVPLTTWRSLSVAIARWLVDGNHLKTSHCPIATKPNGRTHYAVSTKPVHASGKPFAKSVQVGPLYFETHYTGRTTAAVFRTIIKRAGQEPAQFKVRFS